MTSYHRTARSDWNTKTAQHFGNTVFDERQTHKQFAYKNEKNENRRKEKNERKQIHEKRERVTDRQADTGRQTDRDRQTEKNTIEQRFDRQANSWHCVIVWCVLW